MKKTNRIYETNKNTFMTHGCRIDAKASNMEKVTICAYPQSGHALPHYKFPLQFCDKRPCINIPVQETDNQYTYITPSIQFHIHPLVLQTEQPL